MSQVECCSCKHLPRNFVENYDEDDEVMDHIFMLDNSEVPLVSFSGPLPYQQKRYAGGKRAGVRDLKALIQRSCRKVGRNISGTVAALSQAIALESSSKGAVKEECRKMAWSSAIKTLMQQHPGSQLPERLISSIRNHFDSLPLSYARAGFKCEQVFLHIKLLEQARLEKSSFPVAVQEQYCGRSRLSNASQTSSSLSSPASSASWDGEERAMVEVVLTFAGGSSVSKTALVSAFKQAGLLIKELQIFEMKPLTLGILVVQGSRENTQQGQMQALLKNSVSKFKHVKFNLSFHHREKSDNVRKSSTECETVRVSQVDRGSLDVDLEVQRSSYCKMANLSYDMAIQENLQILIDEKQGIISGMEKIQPWLLDPAKIEMPDSAVDNSSGDTCSGIYDGCKVIVKPLHSSRTQKDVAEVQLRREVLDLCVWPHKNIWPLVGIYMDNHHRLCAVNRVVEGESLKELVKKRKIGLPDVVSFAVDIADGMQFLHHHGVAHRDLKTDYIYIGCCGSAIIGGLNVAQLTPEEVQMAHEVRSHIAPEALRAVSSRVSFAAKSDVYSFGIVLWEMLTSETPYAGYSPDHAAVAEGVHGLRPTIPEDCYPPLRYLMQHCWVSNPSDRPTFTAILDVLQLARRGLLGSTNTKAR